MYMGYSWDVCGYIAVYVECNYGILELCSMNVMGCMRTCDGVHVHGCVLGKRWLIHAI